MLQIKATRYLGLLHLFNCQRKVWELVWELLSTKQQRLLLFWQSKPMLLPLPLENLMWTLSHLNAVWCRLHYPGIILHMIFCLRYTLLGLDLTFLFQLAAMFLFDGVPLKFSHKNLSISTFAFAYMLLLNEYLPVLCFLLMKSKLFWCLFLYDKWIIFSIECRSFLYPQV